MKKLEVTDLKDHLPSDPVATKAAEVKKEAEQAEQEGRRMVQKSYALPRSDIEYINALSLTLGQERGKNVSASEALRIIISGYREGKQ